MMVMMLTPLPADSREARQWLHPTCDSIAHVLNDLYIEGHVSRADAVEVIDACVEYYHS